MNDDSANCPDANLIKSWLRGNVAERSAESIADHVTQCKKCQSAVELVESVGDGEPRTVTGHTETSKTTASDFVGTVVGPHVAPRRIRDYDIQELLGHGGMGHVYRAIHRELGKTVAMKLLTPSRINDPESLARFKREMQAVGSLEHPNIIFAMDAGHEGDSHFIVTELVTGRNLRQLLNRYGTLPIENACEITRQAALGLSYAHEQHLLHRDVKPSNVMVTDRGVVKLLDLGLACFLSDSDRQSSDLTASGQVLGTVDYISPEQADGHCPVDHRSDIYSLGVTLFKLLTGRVPFYGPEFVSVARKMAAVMQQNASSISLLRPDLPKQLSRLIDSMLANKPARRPASAASVAKQLEPFCTNADLAELVVGCDANVPPDGSVTAALETCPMRNTGTATRHRFHLTVVVGTLIGTAMLAGLAWRNLKSVPTTKVLLDSMNVSSIPGVSATESNIDRPATPQQPFDPIPTRLGKSEGFDVALADFDNDGFLDAFFANGGFVGRYANRVWLNDSAGTLGIEEAKLGASGSMAVAVGDLDSDGDIDAIVANALESKNRAATSRIWINNGKGEFTRTPQYLSTPTAFDVALADVDGDGDLDACICQRDEGGDGIWLNDGSGTFERGDDLHSGGSTVDIDFGDVDSDGDIDLLVTDIAEDQPNQIFINDGSGNFVDSGQHLGFGTYRRGVLFDMDGDGDLDAVFIRRFAGDGEIWQNNGKGVFELLTTFLGGDYLGLAIGDVNRDGSVDIVVATGSADGPAPNLIFFNLGDTLSDPVELPYADPSSNVALADIDNDGDLDLFVTNRQSENLLWINTTVTKPADR